MRAAGVIGAGRARRNGRVRRTRPVVVALAATLASVVVVRGSANASAPQATPYSPTGTYANGALLPNGRLVNPAGALAPLGDFPVAIVPSPRGDIAVVSNAGQGEGSTPDQGNQSLQVVDLSSNRVVQTVSDHAPNKDTFYNEGVAFSPNGSQLYVTGGGNDAVYDYAVSDGRLRLRATWTSTRKAKVPRAPSLADANGYSRNLTVSRDGKRLFVTNEQGGSVAALDTTTGAIVWESQLPGSTWLGPYPAGIALSRDGSVAYVAAQGENAVFSVDATTGVVRGATGAGDHPVSLALTRDGRYAFVANDNDDTVTILDLSQRSPAQVGRISTHLFPGEANGSAPDAVAVDDQRKVVYVADAGDDAVAVLGQDLSTPPRTWDPSRLRVLGFLPTAWYPTAVSVVPGDGSLLTASAKGLGGVPVTRHTEYDGNDMIGIAAHVRRPSLSDAQRGRSAALSDLLFGARANQSRPAASPIPDTSHAGLGPIKHVVLVVRENRTFDQVLGDLPRSSGADTDPQFVEFGRRDSKGRTVTPNAHDLAVQFALSDNFYSDGEASIQGHYWTALGVSTDYLEKSWLDYYSSRNHPYDPTAPVAYPRCGAIFQQLALAGKTFRNFGELEGLTTSQAPSPPAPGASCAVPGGVADAASVANADTTAGNNLTLTSVKDTLRLAELEKVYSPLVASNQVPDFSYVLMGNDHTGGGVVGTPTPQAQVATNDLAVGGLVDYLSHTPQWSSTAVFVMEDDSQDGLDHRDGHRNILLVASPYAKRGVNHLHVSQASVLHTIELILGLRPLSSYTQTAPVPYGMFTSNPDPTPYRAETPTYPIDASNPSPLYGSPAAVPIDLSGIDLAGPVLEAQIWWATNPGRPMPQMLLDELASHGGITPQALRAWASGRPCACQPLVPGLRVAPGFGDTDG